MMTVHNMPAARMRPPPDIPYSRSVEYRVWRSMIERCYQRTHPKYPRYGGRGITVCKRWRKSFFNFLADVGRRPAPKMTIDRENNDGNYEPGNVRWATAKEQARNRSSNRIVALNGERTSLIVACEKLGLRYGTIKRRLQRGWDETKALMTPIG